MNKLKDYLDDTKESVEDVVETVEERIARIKAQLDEHRKDAVDEARMSHGKIRGYLEIHGRAMLGAAVASMFLTTTILAILYYVG